MYPNQKSKKYRQAMWGAESFKGIGPFMHMRAIAPMNKQGMILTICGMWVGIDSVNNDPSCPDCLYALRDMKSVLTNSAR